MNIVTLREMLAEQMALLRDGKGEPKTVNAMVNAAGKIISTVRLELEYAKLVGGSPTIGFVADQSISIKGLASKKK